MSNVFVGQLVLVPYTFPPKGFAFCQGQLLAISQNTALFSLLGTQFGGDGRSNFALPNLQGRVPMGQGQGPGLQSYVMGEASGTTAVTLLTSEIPMHNHTIFDSPAPFPPPVGGPGGNSPGQPAAGTNIYVAGNQNVAMNQNALPPAGGNQPHNNVMPTLTLNWVIALQGIFPPRQ
jgi:microcystin-dependent protein